MLDNADRPLRSPDVDSVVLNHLVEQIDAVHACVTEAHTFRAIHFDESTSLFIPPLGLVFLSDLDERSVDKRRILRASTQSQVTAASETHCEAEAYMYKRLYTYRKCNEDAMSIRTLSKMYSRS